MKYTRGDVGGKLDKEFERAEVAFHFSRAIDTRDGLKGVESLKSTYQVRGAPNCGLKEGDVGVW